jgi:hypothetical protein
LDVDVEMRKKIQLFIVLALLFMQPFTVFALTSSEVKQDWYDAREASRNAQEAHREAKVTWAADKSEENKQEVIDTGKAALHAALDEVEAWLIWRNLEVEENPEIPEDLKQAIQEDVNTNLGKIDELRADVDGVDSQLGLGLVFLKMVGKYLELLTDVARNTGLVWVHIGRTYAETVEEYESELRDAAEGLSENDDILELLDQARDELEEARDNIENADILELLDQARDELEEARDNIENAEEEYFEVVLPGRPLVSFSNGNQYLRLAKNNLLTAHSYLNEAYREMVGG